jgi:hypothetical protein
VVKISSLDFFAKFVEDVYPRAVGPPAVEYAPFNLPFPKDISPEDAYKLQQASLSFQEFRFTRQDRAKKMERSIIILSSLQQSSSPAVRYHAEWCSIFATINQFEYIDLVINWFEVPIEHKVRADNLIELIKKFEASEYVSGSHLERVALLYLKLSIQLPFVSIAGIVPFTTTHTKVSEVKKNAEFNEKIALESMNKRWLWTTKFMQHLMSSSGSTKARTVTSKVRKMMLRIAMEEMYFTVTKFLKEPELVVPVEALFVAFNDKLQLEMIKPSIADYTVERKMTRYVGTIADAINKLIREIDDFIADPGVKFVNGRAVKVKLQGLQLG